MKSIDQLKRQQSGFTIVELMIAMAVLSVVLLVVTLAMLNIGNLYNKGINQAKVQNAARSLSDEISSHLQIMSQGASPVPSVVGQVNVEGQNVDVSVACMGDTRYTFVIGVQQGSNSTAEQPQIPHVLWRDKCEGPTPNLAASVPSSNGTELVPNRARLTQFEVSGTGVYNVKVGIAYGDNDLLTDPPSGANVRCKSGANTKFCATAYLNTKVASRL